MQTALRPYAAAGVALVGAGLILATPVTAPPPDVQVRAVQLTAGEDVGLVVGGSGTPIPPPSYVDPANELYIQRILPGATPQGVFTPEGLSPIYTGVKSLPLDTSVAQGTTMLDSYVTDSVNAGNTVAVFGESQSSTIAGFVMSDLEKAGIPADALKFVLVGDPSNPDGGLLERFAGLSLPSLGITFSGATPPDTSYDTSIYTQEYDGFADFPKYPLNFLSDLNAFLGIQAVHPTYRALSPEQLDNAIVLQTTPDYTGDTTYYMIPHSAPLVDLIGSIFGKPVQDLVGPVLTQLINLGYDNPENNGWDVGQANVPTEFGLFPSMQQVMTAIHNLGTAAQQGAAAFMSDLSSPASLTADLASAGGTSTAADLVAAPMGLTDIVNALSGALSQAYSVLLPTADIITALAVQMPTYDVTLFLDNLNNPLDAIGLPLAADTGLLTLAAGIEYMVIEQTAQSISALF
ncbi:MAG TPA: PE-PPE domain-containing protein [Mycobacterium sp.]|nr:PE-PPE domain-containing protein [Mycobacterium sp.]